MIRFAAFTSILAVACVVLCSSSAHAQWWQETETGAAYPGYNDVRIPGDDGDMLSLSEDLDPKPNYFMRLRLGYSFEGGHNLFALYAPLRLYSRGRLDRDIVFNGEQYSRGSTVRATYRFDSYRLSYRYDFYRGESFSAGAGLTLKIRDAAIALDGEHYSEKPNVGFVPLINFKLAYDFSNAFGLLLEGDALAAPQGRAEDILAAVRIGLTDYSDLHLGYRMLEGGADNDEVYTFALIHYAVIGLRINFQ